MVAAAASAARDGQRPEPLVNIIVDFSDDAADSDDAGDLRDGDAEHDGTGDDEHDEDGDGDGDGARHT
jgi:hypothetical protein